MHGRSKPFAGARRRQSPCLRHLGSAVPPIPSCCPLCACCSSSSSGRCRRPCDLQTGFRVLRLARPLEKAAACARLPGVPSFSSFSCSSSDSSRPSTAASAAHALSCKASTFFIYAFGSSLVRGLPHLLRSSFGGYPLAPLAPRGSRWLCDSNATLSRLRPACIVATG